MQSIEDDSARALVQELTASSSGKLQRHATTPFIQKKLIKENIRTVYKIGK